MEQNILWIRHTLKEALTCFIHTVFVTPSTAMVTVIRSIMDMVIRFTEDGFGKN
jgi:hypothetical protein